MHERRRRMPNQWQKHKEKSYTPVEVEGTVNDAGRLDKIATSTGRMTVSALLIPDLDQDSKRV